MDPGRKPVVILGGGLAGLCAGHVLSRAGRRVQVLEADAAVGGLARTVVHGGFRFDLGGHRFHTSRPRIGELVRELLGEELLTVPRTSKILLRRRYFDYPLRPLNAVFGFGMARSVMILLGYARARAEARLRPSSPTTLEDWVVANFGRPLFELYFRDYSEKVWGIPCQRIAAEWMAQRVQGLSLGGAIRQALFRARGDAMPTLADAFLYPRLGIGRIADKLHAGIVGSGVVLTDARVTAIHHSGSLVRSVTVRQDGRIREISGEDFIATIPLPQVARLLLPRAPAQVLAAAARLRQRDLIIVAVMLDQPRATGLTWLYFPEKDIPFGRLHEPTNWSAQMAPPGKTLLVTEHFCFRGDATWGATDEDLVAATVAHLERLGLVRREKVIEGVVRRVPAAYPLFDVGHREHCEALLAYLGQFSNLQVAGRGGMFRYHNMDGAMESGMDAAEALLRRRAQARDEAPAKSAVGRA
jgi:protoporphyrinogen oxidase